ncbi:MAG: carbon storage regulator [Candidatus Thiodiazotropha sp. (ex Rostrolucina anterorostrata)]|nr:carbon storage regulator [Candidatus Thiodiazotropha sp. (ex Rostrolucina anterorostrata)]
MFRVTRRPGESVMIAEEIKIDVSFIKGNQVRLNIESPRNLPVNKTEVYKRLRGGNSAVRVDY